MAIQYYRVFFILATLFLYLFMNVKTRNLIYWRLALLPSSSLITFLQN
jgi:hypothetical protein